MRRIVTVVIVAVSLASCDRAERSVPAFAAPAPIATKVLEERKRTLAYEHSVSLKAPSENIPTAFASIRAKCAELSDSCEVLESRIDASQFPSATLKLRVAPKSIANILDSLGKIGELTGQSTSAEDLAIPIADGNKKLALKADYRARLEALLPKASADVDSLIKINRELAQVQAELEEAAGQSAFLAKRVNTELLHISIESPQSQSAWALLNDTPGAISRNLASGTAAVIATVSFLVPWLLLLAVLVAIYKAFRRIRRHRAGA